MLSVYCQNFSNKLQDYIDKITPKTCQQCGFDCIDDPFVSPKDDDFATTDIDNMEILCRFCFNCKHIDLIKYKSEASLIYCPELSQEQVNYFNRTYLIAKYYKENWRAIYKAVEEVVNLAPDPQQDKEIRDGQSEIDDIWEFFEEYWGDKIALGGEAAQSRICTQSPFVLGNILWWLANKKPNMYAQRDDLFYGIRLWHKGHKIKNGVNIYDNILKKMCEEGPFKCGENDPTKWKSLISQHIKYE